MTKHQSKEDKAKRYSFIIPNQSRDRLHKKNVASKLPAEGQFGQYNSFFEHNKAHQPLLDRKAKELGKHPFDLK